MKTFTWPDGSKHIVPHQSQIPKGMEFMLTPDFKQIWRKTK